MLVCCYAFMQFYPSCIAIFEFIFCILLHLQNMDTMDIIANFDMCTSMQYLLQTAMFDVHVGAFRAVYTGGSTHSFTCLVYLIKTCGFLSNLLSLGAVAICVITKYFFVVVVVFIFVVIIQFRCVLLVTLN